MLATTRAAAPLSGCLDGASVGSRRAWEALSPSLRSVAPLLSRALARPVGAAADFVVGAVLSAVFSGAGEGFGGGSADDEPLLDVALVAELVGEVVSLGW